MEAADHGIDRHRTNCFRAAVSMFSIHPWRGRIRQSRPAPWTSSRSAIGPRVWCLLPAPAVRALFRSRSVTFREDPRDRPREPDARGDLPGFAVLDEFAAGRFEVAPHGDHRIPFPAVPPWPAIQDSPGGVDLGQRRGIRLLHFPAQGQQSAGMVGMEVNDTTSRTPAESTFISRTFCSTVSGRAPV